MYRYDYTHKNTYTYLSRRSELVSRYLFCLQGVPPISATGKVVESRWKGGEKVVERFLLR